MPSEAMGDSEILNSKQREEMAIGDRRRAQLVPLASLIGRELRNEKMEKPCVRYGCAAQSRKGEDYFLVKTDCQRVPGNASTSFSVFAVCSLKLWLCLYLCNFTACWFSLPSFWLFRDSMIS